MRQSSFRIDWFSSKSTPRKATSGQATESFQQESGSPSKLSIVFENATEADIETIKMSNGQCSTSAPLTPTTTPTPRVGESADEMNQSFGKNHTNTKVNNVLIPILTEQEIRRNRVFMTIAHFLLTYPKWSISLFLLLASCSVPLERPVEGIREPLSSLRAWTKQESYLYHRCVNQSFRSIQSRLNKTVQTEVDRVNNARRRNLELLVQAEEVSWRCHNNSIKARHALQVWNVHEKVPVLTDDNLTCTAQDRSNLTAILGQDTTHVENQVKSVMETYTKETRSSLQIVTDYAERRSAYDYNYFVGIKLKSIQYFLWSLGAPDIELSVVQVDMIHRFTLTVQPLIDALHALDVRQQALALRLAEFYASIEYFYVNYNNLLDKFTVVSQFMRDFLPNRIPLPDIFDIDMFPEAAALLPPTFETPSITLPIPDIDALLQHFIQDALQTISDLLLSLSQQVWTQARQYADNVIAELQKLLTLEDYDPPQFVGSKDGLYTLQDELDWVSQLGQRAKLDTASALDNLRSGTIGTLSLPRMNAPNVSFESPTLSENATSFQYLEPKFPSISIPEILETIFTFIVEYQCIVEMFVQLYRLVRIKAKYERDALPELPEIDFCQENGGGDDSNDDVEENQPRRLQMIQMSLMTHLLSPWTIFGLLLLPFALMVVIYWFPYVRSKCVHDRDHREGTFVARNFWAPLLINQANIPGNTLFTMGEVECKRNQRQYCGRLLTETEGYQQADVLTLASAQNRFEQAVEVIDLLDRCIETTALDYKFALHCCGLHGYGTAPCSPLQVQNMCPIDNTTVPPSSFRPVGEYLETQSCKADTRTKIMNWQLEDATFNCSVLEDTCSHVPCQGVDADLITFLSIEADCQVETYAIRWCLMILVAVYHAMVLNLCTSLVFTGVKHLRWRSLKPDGIKIRTPVTEDGILVKGAGNREERMAKIAEAMRQFELQGWMQLFVGSILFFIWFISFFVIRKLVQMFDLS